MDEAGKAFIRNELVKIFSELIEPDVMRASIVQDDGTLEDLTRMNGRRQGLQDNFPNMDNMDMGKLSNYL